MTTIRLLERYGLLSPRMLLSHALYVDEEEQQLPAFQQSRAGALQPVGDGWLEQREQLMKSSVWRHK